MSKQKRMREFDWPKRAAVDGSFRYLCPRQERCPVHVHNPKDGFPTWKALQGHFTSNPRCNPSTWASSVKEAKDAAPNYSELPITLEVDMDLDDILFSGNDILFSGEDGRDDDKGEASTAPNFDAEDLVDNLLPTQQASASAEPDHATETGSDGDHKTPAQQPRRIGLFRHLHPRAPQPIGLQPVAPNDPNASGEGLPAAGPGGHPSNPFFPWQNEADFLFSVHLRRTMTSNNFNKFCKLEKVSPSLSLHDDVLILHLHPRFCLWSAQRIEHERSSSWTLTSAAAITSSLIRGWTTCLRIYGRSPGRVDGSRYQPARVRN